MIGVVDYGVANLGSMQNMLRRIGAQSRVISAPAELSGVTKLILPGIGSFDHGMAALNRAGLVEPLRQLVQVDRVPLLGVCLGFQLLGRHSEEGQLGGLALINAHCRRFLVGARRLKVPHMGWSSVQVRRQGRLLPAIERDARFYFVHSYHLVCEQEEDIIAVSSYGDDFVSVIERDNIYGVQFHPEKSHRFGMTLLRNFVSL